MSLFKSSKQSSQPSAQQNLHIMGPIFMAVVATLVFTPSTRAASGGHALEPSVPKGPAQWYQGRTPVDLSHGLPFNNGTYGLPNLAYEKWANTETVVPGMSSLTYPFTEKTAFVTTLEESQSFIRAAVNNWKNVTEEYSKPEGKQFAQTAVQTMEPMLEKFADAISKAKGAGEGDWETAQSEARRALIEVRGAYAQLHKNTSGF